MEKNVFKQGCLILLLLYIIGADFLKWKIDIGRNWVHHLI